MSGPIILTTVTIHECSHGLTNVDLNRFYLFYAEYLTNILRKISSRPPQRHQLPLAHSNIPHIPHSRRPFKGALADVHDLQRELQPQRPGLVGGQRVGAPREGGDGGQHPVLDAVPRVVGQKHGLDRVVLEDTLDVGDRFRFDGRECPERGEAEDGDPLALG